MSKIPVIDWRFGDKYYITEFITPDTYMVEKVSKKLKCKTEKETIIKIAKYIRDNFYYPFNWRGYPSADAQFLKSKKYPGNYHFKKCVDYMWLFPSETINVGFGICIDTSLLAVSLMRNLNINAWCCLGAIYDKREILLGYHAWVEFELYKKWFILETTIHEKDVCNIIKREDGYTGRFGIRYDKYSEFNEKEYREYKPLINFIQFFGKGKKEIQKMEKRKQKVIWKTYRKLHFKIHEVINL